MRLDLFKKGDSVLLLGEGNFSFSVCLHKYRLPIHITATCIQSEPESEGELQNIQYLKANDVAVFFNVDATNLQEVRHFSGVKFSKIIFNFPHVGGKMKIHLNRELLRNFFLSAGHVLADDGLVLVSLCQGQGGTPADHPQRRWNDTWQVVEMAAEGNFILTDIEPFLLENFQGYKCVGYRSQNVGFHLNGALVHMFSKKSPFDDLNTLMHLSDSDVLGSPIYSQLYLRNPIANPDSAISFLQQILAESLKEHDIKIVQMMPFYSETQDGNQCEKGLRKLSLPSDPTDLFPELFQLAQCTNFKEKLILLPVVHMQGSGADFLRNPPIDFKFTVSGKNLLSEMVRFLNNLISIFKEEHTIVSNGNPLTCRNTKTGVEVEAVQFHWFRSVEYCVINAQFICQYLFRVNWRQIWADHKITTRGIPILKPGLLYPRRYEFDITLRYKKPFSDEDFMRILWLGGGTLIEEVKFVNEYASDQWSSKCYRMAYRSLDRPMYRKRVVEIHSMLGRVLSAKLGVTIG